MATELAFRTPLRFRCLEGCGLCCTFRVPVLAGEMAFLQAHAHAVIRDEVADEALAPSVAGRLRREGGSCVLLDEDRRCTVYPDRPIYCRLFPLIRDSYAERQVDAHFACPGLGVGEPFTEADFEGVAELEATAADLAGWERRQRHAYEFAVQILRARGAYCDDHALREAMAGLVSQALQRGPTLDLGERLRQAVEAARPALVALGNVEHPAPVQDALSALPEGQGDGLSPEEADALRDYLTLWVRRNLALRAAHAQALGPVIPDNVCYHFARIVATAALEVCAAAQHSSEDNRVTAAIRRVEAALRSRYMSARITLG